MPALSLAAPVSTTTPQEPEPSPTSVHPSSLPTVHAQKRNDPGLSGLGRPAPSGLWWWGGVVVISVRRSESIPYGDAFTQEPA